MVTTKAATTLSRVEIVSESYPRVTMGMVTLGLCGLNPSRGGNALVCVVAGSRATNQIIHSDPRIWIVLTPLLCGPLTHTQTPE